MKLMTAYSVRLSKGYSRIFEDTVKKYREAVNFFIGVMMEKPDLFVSCKGTLNGCIETCEHLCVTSKNRPSVPFDFSVSFYKFPCYLRRSAIMDAFGLFSSWHSNTENWKSKGRKGRAPGIPDAGYKHPAMYRDNTFVRVDDYTAELKVWIRNTWDWVRVDMRKCDVDYILHHCAKRKECVPVLCRRGRCWSLDFSFEEHITLNDTAPHKRRIVAVDLGINNACTCCVMEPDGTVIGRHFLKLPREYDCLNTMLGRIREAQRQGARRMPRLWALADGINRHIAERTARFIADIFVQYSADCVVMEALNLQGRKRGKMKQRLHLWKAKTVQSIVANKVHRWKGRVSTVCAWNTSRLAFDGSGEVKRGKESERTDGNYSLCEFSTGKLYHCDLNASYNIGARYFIREIFKTLSDSRQKQIEAKVPHCSKRSTCTLSDLRDLRVALAS